MDEAELLIAQRRLERWPKSWRAMILQLPTSEARLIVEAVALLDARPSDGDEGSEA